VRVESTPLAREWLGAGLVDFLTFQWHGETFTIPRDAERILTAEHCANQAYVLDNRHLGMQCHVEVTPEIISTWCEIGADEVAENLASPAVQPVERIKGEMAANLDVLNRTAERLYARWAQGLVP